MRGESVSWTGIALFLTVLPVAGQTVDAGLIDKWIAEPGARAEAQGSVTVVQRGTVRTTRLYSDFIFRFEFRQPKPTAEGRVLVRSRFGYGSGERGYRIALTNRIAGPDALGRIASTGVGMNDTKFGPAPLSGSVGDWQECEIRAERDRLIVSVNGTIVSSAEKLDEFTGYVALQSRRDAIEFRNLRIERLPPIGERFGQGAYSADEPGITLPRPVKTAKPFYPVEPHAAWIQGVVGLSLVVNADGLPGDVRVVKSLHPDLDEAAIASARQWQFKPGTKAGQAVPVIVSMEVSFTRTR